MPAIQAPHIHSPSSYKPSPMLSFCPHLEQVGKIGREDF